MCNALAADGASVVVLDQNKEGAKKVASELISYGFNAISIIADLASKIQVR